MLKEREKYWEVFVARHQSHHHHTHESHESSLLDELGCHFPWATFSVAIGFVFLSIIYFMGLCLEEAQACAGYYVLFHSFHYLHIIYAVVGTMVTFSRFSHNLIKGLFLSIISPLIFCTLSDIVLPALAGNMLGVPIKIHICLFSELHNIIPLLFMGLITGFLLRHHQESSLGFISLWSHFVHILISSLAALCYIASAGFSEWYEYLGFLFVLLVGAVVVPCTLSDIVVPWYFARGKRHAKHSV